MFNALFKVPKTGVLEVHECFGVGWLESYKLLPTKESVSKFGELLFEKPANVPDCDSEGPSHGPGDLRMAAVTDILSWKRAATSPPNALVAMIQERVNTQNPRKLAKLLIKYAVFKTFLYGSLGRKESEVLKSIFPKPFTSCNYLAEHWILIDELSRVSRPGGVFAVFAANWSNCVAREILTNLKVKDPELVTKLVKAYVEGSDEDRAEVSINLFELLDFECQYYLATTFADIKPYYSKMYVPVCYILSRFSMLPSEKVRMACLEGSPEYLIYEKEKTHQVNAHSRTEAYNLSPDALPEEIWLEILLHLDLLSLLCTMPMVCTLWRSWHCGRLKEYLTVHGTFVEDLNSNGQLAMMFHFKCCSRGRSLTSRLTTLKYLLYRSSPKILDFQVKSVMKNFWESVEHEIKENRVSIPPSLYLNLYLSLRKAVTYRLKLRPIPGMSDKEYVASIKNLVEHRGIVPNVPARFWKRDCQRFVKMLSDDSDLFTELLQGDPRRCSMLVVHLFSAKSHIPPAIAVVLEKMSALYNFLFSGDDNIEAYLDIVSCGHDSGDRDLYVLAHNVVNLCLLLGPDGDPEMLQLLKDRVKYCCRTGRFSDTMYLRWLGADVVMLLSKGCQNYSEDELRIIKEVLEKSGIWSEDAKQNIFQMCIHMFSKDPKFSIQMAN